MCTELERPLRLFQYLPDELGHSFPLTLGFGNKEFNALDPDVGFYQDLLQPVTVAATESLRKTLAKARKSLPKFLPL